MRNLFRCVAVVALSASAVSAYAWGYEGHRIAANVASAMLTPQAKVKIGALMPGVDLADISTYMDEERIALKRQIPGSDKWHYNNAPVCTKAPVTASCSNGNCATSQIENFEKVLANPGLSKDERIFALKALVHLVADIHQPLHAADHDDRGGNDVKIGSTNLHSEWDSGIVKKLIRGQSAEAYAQSLVTRANGRLKQFQQGDSSSWAEESHDLAVRVAYGALPGFSCGQAMPQISKLPGEYLQAAVPVVEAQLAKAGARIAFVLNRAMQ